MVNLIKTLFVILIYITLLLYQLYVGIYDKKLSYDSKSIIGTICMCSAFIISVIWVLV